MRYYKRFNQWTYYHLRRKKGCLAGWFVDGWLCMLWLFVSAFFLVFGIYYTVFGGIWKLICRIFGIRPRKMKQSESGCAYETRIADALRRQGYQDVYVTSKSGDYGADVIAIDPDGNKVAIQCKYYTFPVGVKAVQEVVAAKGHYGCTKSAVYTNSSFTQQAKNLAFENEVELYEFFDAIMN